jgi:hypothetical protein
MQRILLTRSGKQLSTLNKSIFVLLRSYSRNFQDYNSHSVIAHQASVTTTSTKPTGTRLLQ